VRSNLAFPYARLASDNEDLATHNFAVADENNVILRLVCPELCWREEPDSWLPQRKNVAFYLANQVLAPETLMKIADVFGGTSRHVVVPPI